VKRLCSDSKIELKKNKKPLDSKKDSRTLPPRKMKELLNNKEWDSELKEIYKGINSAT
jgi:hypothetical protein